MKGNGDRNVGSDFISHFSWICDKVFDAVNNPGAHMNSTHCGLDWHVSNGKIKANDDDTVHCRGLNSYLLPALFRQFGWF